MYWLGVRFDRLDETAELWDTMALSAGARGRQIVLSPAGLIRVASATLAAIAIFPLAAGPAL